MVKEGRIEYLSEWLVNCFINFLVKHLEKWRKPFHLTVVIMYESIFQQNNGQLYGNGNAVQLCTSYETCFKNNNYYSTLRTFYLKGFEVKTS
jgi:uncharacterized protein with WD repeat